MSKNSTILEAPLMLTIREASEKTGISTTTIRTWIKTGVLPHIMVGRKSLISWQNFCVFLNSDMGNKTKGE